MLTPGRNFNWRQTLIAIYQQDEEKGILWVTSQGLYTRTGSPGWHSIDLILTLVNYVMGSGFVYSQKAYMYTPVFFHVSVHLFAVFSRYICIYQHGVSYRQVYSRIFVCASETFYPDCGFKVLTTTCWWVLHISCVALCVRTFVPNTSSLTIGTQKFCCYMQMQFFKVFSHFRINVWILHKNKADMSTCRQGHHQEQSWYVCM